MLIDSHCHLNLLDLTPHGGNLDTALHAAREQGVTHMLCVSVDLEHFPEVLHIAEQYNDVSATIGVHPNEKLEHALTPEHLMQLAKHNKIMGIGETGLDYYRSEGDLDWQRERFRCHIEVAKQVKKPLIVHTRQASADTLQILQQEHAEDVGGVMHCFTETWEVAKQALDLGFYISFSGILTFKNAVELQEVARKVPIDRVLIETDSPYLAPMPHRGRPNEPAYVKYVALQLAELRNLSFATIAQHTTDNFLTLFKLQQSKAEA